MENYEKVIQKQNEFKISAPTWIDGSCSASDIQDYFEYILKQHG